MNPKVFGAVLTIVGAGLLILNAPLKPFDSGFEGPLVLLIEFVGPLVFSVGISVFGYQLTSFIKTKEWPEIIPQKILVVSIVAGFVASVLLLIYRML